MAKILTILLSETDAFGNLLFGNQNIDDSFTTQDFTIKADASNSGSITITAINLTGTGFAWSVSPTLPLVLAPSDQSTFPIEFDPSTIGVKTGNVNIVSDADSPDDNIDIPLIGTGVANFKRVIAKMDNDHYLTRVFHWAQGNVTKNSYLEQISGIFKDSGQVMIQETDPESYLLVSQQCDVEITQIPTAIKADALDIFRMINSGDSNYDAVYSSVADKFNLYIEIYYYDTATTTLLFIKPDLYKKTRDSASGGWDIGITFYDGVADLDQLRRFEPDGVTNTPYWIWTTGFNYNLMLVVTQIYRYIIRTPSGGVTAPTWYHEWYWHKNDAVPYSYDHRFDDLYVAGGTINGSGSFDFINNGVDLLRSICQSFNMTFGFKGELVPYINYRTKLTSLTDIATIVNDDIVIESYLQSYEGLYIPDYSGSNDPIEKGTVYTTSGSVTDPKRNKEIFCLWQTQNKSGSGSFTNLYFSSSMSDFIDSATRNPNPDTMYANQELVADDWWEWYQKVQLKISFSCPTFALGTPVSIDGYYSTTIDGQQFKMRPFRIKRDLKEFVDYIEFVTIEN